MASQPNFIYYQNEKLIQRGGHVPGGRLTTWQRPTFSAGWDFYA